VIELQVLNGQKAGTRAVATRLPFLVGRVPANHLVLEDDGVWERHLSIRRQGNQLLLTAEHEAFVAVNGERIQEAVLRNGDVFDVGSVKLRFGLSPTRQHSLWLRETVTWVALALLCLGQIALIYLL
jgi:pSer/pThr/pTyr-binding forkhead associated (FHA) protein